tara:strand:- start:661 stop:1233 length:573 start_codon:yes stop_codon:yes gene_type:complete
MKHQIAVRIKFLATIILICNAPYLIAQESRGDYGVQPGDILAVSVWKEDGLQADVLVRPDGKFSFPLTGDIIATGRSIDAIRDSVIEQIAEYIPDPVVTVQLRQILGNKVYVIGKVLRPGEIVMTHDVDVMQALSIAGGTTTFADLDDIKILRRSDGALIAISFAYSDVERGRSLEQNILLTPGDIVVVP